MRACTPRRQRRKYSQVRYSRMTTQEPHKRPFLCACETPLGLSIRDGFQRCVFRRHIPETTSAISRQCH